jgi:3'-5' exoribonuclease
MTYKLIKDMAVDEQLEQVCLVSQVEAKTTKAGKPFTKVTIKDKSGTLPINIWQMSALDMTDLKAGCYAVFKLKVEEYKGIKGGNASPPMVVKAPDDLTPYQNANGLADDLADQYYQILLDAKNKVTNVYIKTYLDVLFDDPAFKKAFTHAPASASNRGAYRGGLVEHVAKVLNNAYGILSSYQNGYIVANINKDIVTAGVLMHDVGKMTAYEIDENGSAKATRKGVLIEHLPLSYGISTLAAEKAAAILHKPIPDEIMDHINHCILSHHGQLAFGSPVTPKSIEAQIVHTADMADSTISNYGEPSKNNASNIDQNGFVEGTRFSSKQLFVGTSHG